MTANRDLDEDGVVEADEEEIDETPRRSSPLRLILLILLALVGLCVLCFLGSRFLPSNILGALPIPGLSRGQPTATAVPVAIDTPTLAPTGATTVPPVGTTEPLPTTQPGATTEQMGETGPTATPGTEQPGATTEPPSTTVEPLPPVTQEPGATQEPFSTVTQEPGATQEPMVTGEPTQDMVDEHGGELPTGEPTATATTQPVPGPTVTPTTGPAPGTTPSTTPQADCSNNVPPVADAGDPYTAMMGKGQAFVTFDGSGSSDPDGTIRTFEWDFGDGETGVGQSVTHGYSSTGTFEATLTVTDNCGTTGESKVQVTITGPTPPAPGTGTPTVTAQPPPSPSPTADASATPDAGAPAGTVGFCYRVQPGNTLTGVANYFGVSVPLLAEVNGVSPAYYVIAGQGLFIPTGEVQPGANLYEVQSGDTLDSIAFQCGLSTAKLANANGLTPGQTLTPGQFLGIPLWTWY